jgi:hypothetical protein
VSPKGTVIMVRMERNARRILSGRFSHAGVVESTSVSALPSAFSDFGSLSQSHDHYPLICLYVFLPLCIFSFWIWGFGSYVRLLLTHSDTYAHAIRLFLASLSPRHLLPALSPSWIFFFPTTLIFAYNLS